MMYFSRLGVGQATILAVLPRNLSGWSTGFRLLFQLSVLEAFGRWGIVGNAAVICPPSSSMKLRFHELPTMV